jgi:hypothetical protein
MALLINILKKPSILPEFMNLYRTEHNARASISISTTFYNKRVNVLFLPESHNISILDGGVDTCPLGKGWELLSVHNSRIANVEGFDHETAIKRNLPIVIAITALELINGQSVLSVMHESIYNETSNQSLLSEFQLREFVILIDYITHLHAGTQKRTVKDNNRSDALTISLDLAGCMINFRYRLHTTDED